MDQNQLQVFAYYTNLLRQTFMASNDADRKQAEQQLNQSVAQDNNFLETLISILKHDQTDDNTKMSASQYIVQFAKIVQSKQQTQQLDQAVLLKIINMICLCLLDEKVSFKLKHTVNNALFLFLKFDQENQIMGQIFQDSLQWAASDSSCQIVAAIFCFQNIFKHTKESNRLEKMYQSFIGPFCNSFIKMMSPLVELFKQQSSSEMKILPEQKIAIIQQFSYIQLWIQTISTLYEQFSTKQQNEDNKLCHLVHYSQNLTEQLLTALTYCVQNASQDSMSIISMSGIPEIDSGLNEIKTQILQLYNMILLNLFKRKDKAVLSKTPLYLSLNNIISILLSSIYRLTQSPNFSLESVQDNEKLEQIVVQIFELITKCIPQNEFYQLFSAQRNVIIVFIVLTFLRSNKQEIESFADKPEEFVNLALDTCDKQYSQTHKTAAAQILENICDHIDGGLTTLIHFTISLIDFSLNCQGIDQITQEQYPVLFEFREALILKKTDLQTICDTSLVALSIMSYLLPKRPDLVDLIENLIRKNFALLFNEQLPNYLKTRVCLFLSYYTDTIFLQEKDQETHDQILKYLINCCQLTDQSQVAIVLQAIDSLSNIYDDDDLTKKLLASVNLIFKQIVQIIPVMKYQQFFDLVQTIVQKFNQELLNEPANITDLIQQLLQRIDCEFKSNPQTSSTSQLIINKCWNIIRSITDSDSYLNAMYSQIFSLVSKIFVYLDNPQLIDFDDDILLVIQAFIKNQKAVDPLLVPAILCFPKCFQKYDCMLGHLFYTINLILAYGKSLLQANVQILEMLLQLGVQSMKAQNKKVTEGDNAEGATLLQFIVQYCYDILTPEMHIKLYGEAFNTLQTKEIKFNFLRGRIIGIIFSAIHINPEQTIIMLQQAMPNTLELLLKTAIDNKLELFISQYDIKVCIFALTNILFLSNSNQALSSQANLLIDNIIQLLKRQEYLENVQQVKKNNNQNNLEDDDDDDDSSDEDSDDDMKKLPFNLNDQDEIIQDKLNLDNIISLIKQKDEFEYFREVIIQLKQRNIGFLQNLIQSLPDNKQSYLRQLVNMKRVPTSDQSESTQARKIVKVRAKQQPNNQ